MVGTIWFLIVGALLVVMALGESVLHRLPLSTSMLYLAVGFVLGPGGFAFVYIDPLERAAVLERVTEVAVLVSLFSAGLKLRVPWSDRRWLTPIRLATGSMVITVALVAALGVVGLGLPLGAAIVLGAVLAPTDPVLASDVQVESATDRDRLRFSLTGEAGMNDGTAFPFVMLGLGLLGLHELGDWGWRWVAVDLVWAVVAGLGVGWGLGTLVGLLVLYLRRVHQEAVGSDDFLALGLIALSYGAALLVKGYGFLAVFAAGLALRHIERRAAERAGGANAPPPELDAAAAEGKKEEIATAPETAPAYMAEAALGFAEQLDRIGEVAVVLLVGTMLSESTLSADALWFVPLLFFVVRPIAVAIGAPMGAAPPIQRTLTMWFGIRGIGSIYYLAYAIAHGMPEEPARRITALVLSTVAASALLHGITVTPLMRRYAQTMRAEGAADARG
ncbi:MAG: sodium/hydrogen exchanger [uncultured Gemmatimonadaceae bacterium]|uniref:Sodium/hydrogen exchanger n=1 Tax=uncultured Gemmatimonadaceae bacterium TaxID=246130 RepID=A0A6J4KDE8_9BACT|nr:MAG: sodium/hydrogen exchanger [uncultured Gemmatimonadaceae bacterium]